MKKALAILGLILLASCSKDDCSSCSAITEGTEIDGTIITRIAPYNGSCDEDGRILSQFNGFTTRVVCN